MNDLLTPLHFKYVQKQLPDLYEQARQHALTYEAFLRRVLSIELEGRACTASRNREKAARLPVRKTLEEFDFADSSSGLFPSAVGVGRTGLSQNAYQHCVVFARRAWGKRT